MLLTGAASSLIMPSLAPGIRGARYPLRVNRSSLRLRTLKKRADREATVCYASRRFLPFGRIILNASHAMRWKARDFALTGTDGKIYSLAEVRGPKGTLVVFICNHCPYVKASINRIVAEANALRGIGIGTIAIMPNDTDAYPEDSFDNMKAFAVQHGFTFAYVIDTTQEVARAYDAQCTPDFFGFNAQDELQYRGRLDASRMTPVPNARATYLKQ